ncbi:hypothetical protein [uncultured Sphingomonas sp.]|uniref:hypothetical protein n=1 Tax=uncultured Sphingomonas sp. TaxID=158754 RepID=UPI0035CC62A3
MTSRPTDSDSVALDSTPPTGGAAVDDTRVVPATRTETQATETQAPTRIRLGRDRHVEVDYRGPAIAAGVLGLGVLAYKGVTAILGRRSKDGGIAKSAAEPFQRDDGTRTAPAATRPAPTFIPADTGAEFIGEPARARSDTPFVAASGADDTAGLLVDVTEIDIVTITPVGGASADTVDGDADRSVLSPEHVPTDLMGDAAPGAGDRAIDAFRPDPTASVPPEMRDSLRPATGPATGFAGNRGDFASGLSQSDGSK